MPAHRQHLSGSGQVSQFAAQVADIHIHRAFGMAADGGLAVSDKGGKRFARHGLAVRLAQYCGRTRGRGVTFLTQDPEKRARVRAGGAVRGGERFLRPSDDRATTPGDTGLIVIEQENALPPERGELTKLLTATAARGTRVIITAPVPRYPLERRRDKRPGPGDLVGWEDVLPLFDAVAFLYTDAYYRIRTGTVAEPGEISVFRGGAAPLCLPVLCRFESGIITDRPPCNPAPDVLQ